MNTNLWYYIQVKIAEKHSKYKSNFQDNSYYKIYNRIGGDKSQLRISNHGTHLHTWTDFGYKPYQCENISIVFNDTDRDDTDTEIKGNYIPFEVHQYEYNLQILSKEDIDVIGKRISEFANKKGFIDPFKDTDKKATHKLLTPNNQPIIVEKLLPLKRLIREIINELLGF